MGRYGVESHSRGDGRQLSEGCTRVLVNSLGFLGILYYRLVGYKNFNQPIDIVMRDHIKRDFQCFSDTFSVST